ncbi:hypothetical protein N7462_009241 [Penicillium macrosclerotiorum]|uniref:uncharacterized protein n=1 Tax=Penicillium macrosclerotiorum TaxID=303699 RepID=UPI002548CFF1|nr:uncharacterized protein N7462_009241 [Penicillium macrosclerotiorum]KAJ5673802.1 hypothetical protein N7462_009241 [Penicillium macrosclerotiorum]
MAPNSTSVTEAVANTQSQHQAFATCSNSHTSPVPSYERSVIGAEERRPFNQSNLDFQNLDLACPINVEEISNRWLNPYIPTPGQKIKNYPATVTSFIYRVLKSYSAVAVRGHRALPFIHPKQSLSGSPLATCLSLIRICEKPLPGSENSAALVLQREMEAIAETRNDYDDMDLLAAFQSYLIYTMALFFHLSQGFNPFFRQAMMNLQELACLTSRQGLVCAADRLHSRPRWEEWIVTEAKRRTLYVMYLFDNILSAQESLPTFLGTELQGLPAPANKPLWQAENRADWEKEFNVYLTKWTTHSLTIDELWPIPQGMDEAGITHRRERVDQWLENMDEFGIMIFTVTVCTHGG